MHQQKTCLTGLSFIDIVLLVDHVFVHLKHKIIIYGPKIQNKLYNAGFPFRHSATLRSAIPPIIV